MNFSTELFQHRWISASLAKGSKAVPRSKQKVMIVLHGRGDSLQAFADIKQELRLPSMNYLLLNAPRRFEAGYSWYALEPRHERGVKQARRLLFELVEELREAGFRPEQIYWLGHSQGGMIACDLVLRHSAVFGGLIGVSGYVWLFRGWRKVAAGSGARQTPWLMTHGSRDRVIEPSEIREDVEQLTRGSVPVMYREFLKGHDFDYDEEVPFIRRWMRSARNFKAFSDLPPLCLYQA